MTLSLCLCSLEVTVTSLHPPRLCCIAVLSIKPTFLTFSKTHRFSSMHFIYRILVPHFHIPVSVNISKLIGLRETGKDAETRTETESESERASERVSESDRERQRERDREQKKEETLNKIPCQREGSVLKRE